MTRVKDFTIEGTPELLNNRWKRVTTQIYTNNFGKDHYTEQFILLIVSQIFYGCYVLCFSKENIYDIVSCQYRLVFKDKKS